MISAAVLLLPVLACLWAGGWPWTVLVVTGAVVLVGEWALMCRNLPLAERACLTIFGLVLVPVATLALIALRADGLPTVGFLLLAVWSTDIGAYLVGRVVGGPKLAPAISPGKTWSGAAGGLLAAIVICNGAGFTLYAAAMALLLSLVTQIGDLAESALKRRCGVKDSSHLIPGHGGLLDRLDGLLLAAPTAYLLVALRGDGLDMAP